MVVSRKVSQHTAQFPLHGCMHRNVCLCVEFGYQSSSKCLPVEFGYQSFLVLEGHFCLSCLSQDLSMVLTRSQHGTGCIRRTSDVNDPDGLIPTGSIHGRHLPPCVYRSPLGVVLLSIKGSGTVGFAERRSRSDDVWSLFKVTHCL